MPDFKQDIQSSTSRDNELDTKVEQRRENVRIYLVVVVSLSILLLLVAYIFTGNAILLITDSTIAGATFVTIITYYFGRQER